MMHVPEHNWHDWRWQFANRLRTEADFAKLMELTESEKEALKSPSFAVAVTPYFASLIQKDNPNCPIRRQAIPLIEESTPDVHGLSDPLAEDAMSPVNNLVHRYPDRVLLIVTETCHMYCRHCTRRRRVGFKEKPISKTDLANALAYIRQNPQIRDVLVSGGDPFTLGDQSLEQIIKAIREIPHVEIIRIGTRAPITNPFRVTARLVRMLRKYHPLWVNVQFNHPLEITPEAANACAMLADAGIPLGNQTVLLRGINDSAAIQKELAHRLVQIRVRPYYLYQCDLAAGIGHFRTPVSLGIEVMEQMLGHTSGFAIPTFVVDAPGGGGKIPILPQYLLCQTPEKIVMRNYEGKIFTYPKPNPK